VSLRCGFLPPGRAAFSNLFGPQISAPAAWEINALGAAAPQGAAFARPNYHIRGFSEQRVIIDESGLTAKVTWQILKGYILSDKPVYLANPDARGGITLLKS
jgi:hypothetical protein